MQKAQRHQPKGATDADGQKIGGEFMPSHGTTVDKGPGGGGSLWPVDPNRDIPIVHLTGNETGPPPNTRQQAARWAKANLRGTYQNTQTGWHLAVFTGGIEEGLHRLTAAKHPEAIAAIPDLIKNAVLIQSEPDHQNRPDIKAFHTFLAPLQIGDKLFTARMTIKELKSSGRQYYGHQIESLELDIEKPGVISGDHKPNGQLGHPRPPGTVKLGQLLARFKSEPGEKT